MDIMQTIIGGLLGGGLIGLIEFLIRRKDEKADKNSEILKRLDKIDERLDRIDAKHEEDKTVTARVRILRFVDELREGRKHSKDSFDQALSDVTTYEQYTAAHPEFHNNQTAASIKFIMKCYEERLEKNDFLC